MITLEYFSEKGWIEVGKYHNERIAWMTLGGDDENYRTKDENESVLTDKLRKPIEALKTEIGSKE